MAIVDVLSISRTDTTTRDESDQGGDSSDPWEDFESDEDEEEQPFQKEDDGNGE